MAHALMFHHFHSEIHPQGQGSLSAEELDNIIAKLRLQRNLLSSDEYLHKCLGNSIKETDVCLSFDDGLKCQFDVALPVLETWNIKAFFFIPTKPLKGEAINLELFRYFRSVFFDDIDDFYTEFFTISQQYNPAAFLEAVKFCETNVYRSEHAFYTQNDRLYRYFRDRCVSSQMFDDIMLAMIKKRTLATEKLFKVLWMNKHEINQLFQSGHEIGLHTHSHPTNIDAYTYDAEYAEYNENLTCLSQLVGKRNIRSAALPCGLSSMHTNDIFKKIGIDLCFTAAMEDKKFNDPLRQPRLDHVLLPSENLQGL